MLESVTRMKLIEFNLDRDFDVIKNWVTDERTHAMWCANYFQYPLEKEDFANVRAAKKAQYGDTAYIAALDDDKPVGFFCYSKDDETNRGMLKFVVVDPEYRGKGVAGEMLQLIAKHSFEKTGAKSLWLCVFPENERAKRCYLKAGFKESGTTENAFTYKDESWSRCNMVLKNEYYTRVQ